MIVIDIPMPQQCMTCPCTCRVRTENTTIRTMCKAKEARGDRYVLRADRRVREHTTGRLPDPDGGPEARV